MTEHQATGVWPPPADAVPVDAPSIPGYEILEELGRGGMGVVYKARQGASQRLVALKVIRDGALAGHQESARFRVEAEAAARVRHPNVIEVCDVGEHHGRLYFAMELIEGGTLADRTAGRPQPPMPSADLVRTLALAVQHAHDHHVVHRDLKPANILLVSGGVASGEWSQGTTHHSPLTTHQPKITDFGLAKRLDSDSTALTHDGAVLGTPSYMAPEQAAGRAAEVGPAADVYALGAILYELVTGRPPFVAESANQTLQQVLYDEPVPPGRLRPDVPRDLETVCLQCLEKDPERRYASARALADDLGRFLDARPVTAVPLGERGRLARLALRDGYRLVGEVGRGPRSTVYHAVYEPLQQPVALKVFPPGTCTRQEWDARLQRGAELWAAVAHPHIVPVHRAGWLDGAPYLAAEYVPQGSLADRLAGRSYPVPQALRLVEQLAEVVRYLHRQGVVHANLKPSNVLLAADGIPRVVDFRATACLPHGPQPADDAEPTGLGYVAPELVRDPGAEPRPYTDIYGLGLILYELLTGRPPFSAATARETLDRVRAAQPPPPSSFNAAVTPSVERCCLRCLHKDPWRRYHRAYDLVARLRRLQDETGGLAVSGERRPNR
jgi:serine/threonine protein kinase